MWRVQSMTSGDKDGQNAEDDDARTERRWPVPPVEEPATRRRAGGGTLTRTRTSCLVCKHRLHQYPQMRGNLTELKRCGQACRAVLLPRGWAKPRFGVCPAVSAVDHGE